MSTTEEILAELETAIVEYEDAEKKRIRRRVDLLLNLNLSTDRFLNRTEVLLVEEIASGIEDLIESTGALVVEEEEEEEEV